MLWASWQLNKREQICPNCTFYVSFLFFPHLFVVPLSNYKTSLWITYKEKEINPWNVTKQDHHSLEVITGPKGCRKWKWRTLHNDKFEDLYSLHDIIMVMKSGLWYTEHITQMKETEFSGWGEDPFVSVHLKDQAENAKIILNIS